MKRLKKIGLVTVGIFVLLLLGAYTTYDYGLDCVKCLAGKHVVVHRFLGIPFYKGTTDGTRVVDYERIIGRPCYHSFRKGGFGKGSYSIFGFRVACGSTREGAMFRFRLGALSSTYQLWRTLGEQALARETMSLIDQLMPADASLHSHIPGTLFQLDDYLRQVSTVEQWRSVLECAKGDFRETPKLASITNGV